MKNIVSLLIASFLFISISSCHSQDYPRPTEVEKQVDFRESKEFQELLIAYQERNQSMDDLHDKVTDNLISTGSAWPDNYSEESIAQFQLEMQNIYNEIEQLRSNGGQSINIEELQEKHLSEESKTIYASLREQRAAHTQTDGDSRNALVSLKRAFPHLTFDEIMEALEESD